MRHHSTHEIPHLAAGGVSPCLSDLPGWRSDLGTPLVAERRMQREQIQWA